MPSKKVPEQPVLADLVGPKTPFGDLQVAEVTPEVQLDFVYGLREGVDTETFTDASPGTGSASSVDSPNNLGFIAECKTGTGVGGYGVIRSLRTAKYRGGQGIEARFTADFDTGVANFRSAVGFLNIGTELSFTMNGDTFSILHRRGGRPEIRTLTVTGAAGGAETATITLDGTAYSVDLTSGTVQHNAAEIASDSDFGTDQAWNAFQVDDTVIFVKNAVGTATGSYSFSSSTATATIAQTAAGQAVTDSYIAQSNWDSQPFSDFDPTNINVYKITYQYLGGGVIKYYILNPQGQWELVHTIDYPNSSSDPNLDYPLLKFGAFAASLGSTTDLGVRTASAALFNTGKIRPLRESRGTSNNASSVGTSLTNIITIRNGRIFNARQNLNEVIPERLSAAVDGTKPAEIHLIKGATFSAETNFQYLDQNNSYIETETTNTTVSNGTEIAVFSLAKDGSFNNILRDLNIRLLRGETLTIAAQATSGTTDVSASLTWLED